MRKTKAFMWSFLILLNVDTINYSNLGAVHLVVLSEKKFSLSNKLKRFYISLSKFDAMFMDKFKDRYQHVLPHSFETCKCSKQTVLSHTVVPLTTDCFTTNYCQKILRIGIYASQKTAYLCNSSFSI